MTFGDRYAFAVGYTPGCITRGCYAVKLEVEQSRLYHVRSGKWAVDFVTRKDFRSKFRQKQVYSVLLRQERLRRDNQKFGEVIEVFSEQI